jgi:hypothetical protein
LVLILDPRIKRQGLTGIGLSSGMASDIYNKLYSDYQCKSYFFINLILIYFLLTFLFSHKIDYLRDHPISKDSDQSMADVDNDDLDIYINNDDDFVEDELTTYLDEKRADKR